MNNKLGLTAILVGHSLFALASSVESQIDEIVETADVHNGDIFVNNYDSESFSYKKEIKTISADLNKKEEAFSCKYVLLSVGRKKTFEAIADRNAIDDVKTAEKLMAMYNEDKRQIKGALMFAWDGKSGDSEYCLRYPTYVYFNNGQRLILSYDYTD